MIRRTTTISASPILASAVALLAITSGCASRPPAEHETQQRQVAPLQASGTAQWPDASWWRGYGDETLNGLIEQALTDSPGLASAAARFGTASENVRIAGAQAGLQVEASAEYELYRLSDNGLIPPDFLGYHWVNQSDLGIGARHTFDWWGRNRALVESATDQARASGAERQAVALALASTIAQTYFGWQADGARIALLEERLVTLQEAAHIARLREDAGLGYANDSERVRGETAAVREQQAQLQGARQLRVIELAALLGVSPDQLAPQLQLRPLPETRAGLPADASIDLMAHRPDIVATRWRVEAARQDVSAIRAEYYPDVSLHALAGLSSVDVVKLLDPGSWAPSMGFAVHLPLFDAGLRDARHGHAAAQLNAAVARYNETIVDAAREVGGAATALEQSAAQRQQRALQLESAAAQMRFAIARQHAGITDLQPELEARLSLLRERDAGIQIDYAALVADIQLQTALGGGLTATESSNE